MAQALKTIETPAATLASPGVAGLDDVLCGGFARNRLYLIQGVPGAGKTTLALQFLLEGVRRGESVLIASLSESEEELRAAAESHGWSLDGVHVHELLPADEGLGPEESYTVFHPSEVELNQTTQWILSAVERLKPTRVVIDSLSEVRLMAGSALRYRRQIMALKRYFSGRNCTVLLLDDPGHVDRDVHVQSIAHGVILLEQRHPEFGPERRRLRVTKYRGTTFRAGFHDFVIRTGGLEVFPRLVAAEHRQNGVRDRLPSGIGELDRLLGGGIEQGTSTLILGAPGVGKSSVAAQFVSAAAGRGQKGIMFVFDESVNTLLTRSASLGSDLGAHVEAGRVVVEPVDPAELSPGEFAHRIRRAVERDHVGIVVIDSLNGYMNAMPDERFMTIQLHELLSFLGQKGVATILIGAQKGLIGANMISSVDATYLADAAILLRYFEAGGEVRQAISIIKKRGGEHERTIREFRLERGCIRVGDPLVQFRGVLTGVPVYDGAAGTLMKA